jgi:hypothetical protein
MYWLLAGIGYIVAVGTIVRFFQFVSDADRTIEGFWTSKNGSISTQCQPRRFVRPARQRVIKVRQRPLLS